MLLKERQHFRKEPTGSIGKCPENGAERKDAMYSRWS
jgi:hypothetical protein